MSVDHQRQYGKSNREVKCCDFEFERLGYMRTLTHTYTHINVAFQTQTNGRGGGVRGGELCGRHHRLVQ